MQTVLVSRVTDVRPHPNSDKLDIVTIMGKTNVANRPAPDTPRYKVGDYAAVLPENLILPEWLLRHLDLWDDTKQKGMLAGSKGNRTKGRRIAGVVSEVALCKVVWECESEGIKNNPDYLLQRVRIIIGDDAKVSIRIVKKGHEGTTEFTPEGIDVSKWLGIEPYSQIV